MFDWKKFFNIRIDSAPADELRDRIESDSTVTGANLVILIAAILIACVGLNMDSTAVIIGAMLISPLMGGLVAVSYGMATYNLHFLKRSMVKLSLPSIYMAGTTVRESIRTSQIESFINQDMDLHAANVISYQLKDGTLFVDVLGARLDEETMENLQKKLNDYGSLSKVRLEVVQSPASSLNKEQVQDLISSRLKQATTQTGGKSYKELAEEYYGSYNRETSTISLLKSLNKEAPALFPAIKEIKGGTVYGKDKDDTWAPAAFEVTVTVTSQLSPSDAEKLKNWIASQTELPVSLTIQMETSPSSYFGNGINWNGN